MGLGKLLGVERTLNIYPVSRSKFMETACREISINDIPLETLKQIIVANVDDPLLYDGYILTEEQLARLNELINEKIAPDFHTFEYCLECYGIYES